MGDTKPQTEQKSDEALISAPAPIVLGGTTYLVAKPTEKDVFSVFFNARKQAARLYNPFREVTDALEGLPVSEQQRTELLLQAHRVKVSGEVPSEALTAYLTGPKGCAFYAWILIRKNHPEVTLETIQAAITDDNCVAVFADLDEASGANLIHKALEDAGFFPRPSP